MAGLHLPKRVEPNPIKRCLRFFRAWCEAIDRRFKPLQLWFRVAMLATVSGLLIVSVSVFGWTLNAGTVFSGFLLLYSVVVVAGALVRHLDDITRDHVGGRKIPCSSGSLTLPAGYQVYVATVNTPEFDMACEFADRFYLGTMGVGQGTASQQRIANRRKAWAKKVNANAEAVCLAVDQNGTLGAVTLVVPLEPGTLDSALAGKMDYASLTSVQMSTETIKPFEKYGVYISVALGDRRHILDAQRSGRDLVGAMLTNHIKRIVTTAKLNPDNAVLVTDGFRGLAMRGFLRRGFEKQGVRNPYGYPVLKLETNAGVPTEPFLKAIQ